ncbi:hypothetical protein [Streptomyces sp. NPDC001070]
MYAYELLGRERTEQLLREAAEYRRAHEARRGAREAARVAAGHRGGADDQDEGRAHGRRAGRFTRRLRTAG